MLWRERQSSRPPTQIPIYDEYGQLVARIDMGWAAIRGAAEYDGAHHRTPKQFRDDIIRAEVISHLDWIDVRVTSLDTEANVIRRVGAARDQRA